MNQPRRQQTSRRRRSWRSFGVWAGLALLLVLAVLFVHGQGASQGGGQAHANGAPPTLTGPTAGNVVPTPTVTPTPTPPITTQVYLPPPYTPPPPVPTVHVVGAVATVDQTGFYGPCRNTDAHSFLIHATLTVTNPVGGVVTYHWRSSDGFTSAPQYVTFARGQTSVVVSDAWTLGAGNADGRPRWEEVVVTAPNSVTSNQPTFIYRCPPTIIGLNVYATRTPATCVSPDNGFDVKAIILVFAPAGGSITSHFKHTENGVPSEQDVTVAVPPGHVEAAAIAYWHVGPGSGANQQEGVTVLSLDGLVLAQPISQTVSLGGNGNGTPTPTPTPTCTPTPTPTPDPTPITVGGITLNDAAATVSPTLYDCTRADPQTFTFAGTAGVTATQDGTLAYQWVRSDGSLGSSGTAAVKAGDTTVTVPNDTWTPTTRPANGPYGEKLIITKIDATDLTPVIESQPALYQVLCP